MERSNSGLAEAGETVVSITPIDGNRSGATHAGWVMDAIAAAAIALLVTGFLFPNDMVAWSMAVRSATALAAISLARVDPTRRRWLGFAAGALALAVQLKWAAAWFGASSVSLTWLVAAGLTDVLVAGALLALLRRTSSVPSVRLTALFAVLFLAWSTLTNGIHTLDPPSGLLARNMPRLTTSTLAREQWLAVTQVHGYVLCVLAVWSLSLRRSVGNLLGWSLIGISIVVATALLYQHVGGEFCYVFQSPDFHNFCRAKAHFESHHNATVVLGISLVALVGLSATSIRRLLAVAPLLALVAAAVVLNSTRSAILTLIFCLPLAVWFSRLKRRRLAAVVGFVLLLVGLYSGHLCYSKTLTGINGRVGLGEVASSNTPRLMLAVRAAEELPAVLWTGAGYSRHHFGLRPDDFWGYRITNSGHVLLLDTALGTGLPGALLLLGATVCLFRVGYLAVGAPRSGIGEAAPPRWEWASASLAVLAATAVLSAFNTTDRSVALELGVLWAGLLPASVAARGIPPSCAERPATNPLSWRLATAVALTSQVVLAVGIGFQIVRAGRYQQLMLTLAEHVDGQSAADAPPVIALNSARGIDFLKRTWPAEMAVPWWRLLAADVSSLELPPGSLVVWDAAENARYAGLVKELGYRQYLYYDWRSIIAFPSHWSLLTARHSPAGLDIYRVGPKLSDNLVAKGAGRTGDVGDGPGAAVDGQLKTYWNAGASVPVTLTVDLTSHPSRAPVACYALVSSDHPSRDHDPCGWVLEGSEDGKHWDLLDQRDNVCFTAFRERQAFSVSTSRPCKHVRFQFIRTRQEGVVLHVGEIEVRTIRR